MNEGQILGAVFDPNSPFLFSADFIFTIVKWMMLVGFGVYLLFAVVIVRQIALMTRTITSGFELFINLLGYGHLLFAVFVWITAYLTL